MLQVIKRLAIFLVFVFGLALTGRLCHRATDGFILSNIYSVSDDKIAVPEAEAIRHILAQKFHYLNKGAQTYVFVSEDGEYVLKFFKFQHLRLPHLLEKAPLPPFLANWRQKKRDRKQRLRAALLKSYALAFERMREEGGLIYVHLAKSSELQSRVTLVDKLHIAHQIDADQVEFVLQKKAKLVVPTLREFQARQDLAGAKAALVSLWKLTQELQKKKIVDRDPHLTKNFGFIGNKPVQIDCGSLVYGVEEAKEKGGGLQKWLQKEWPELAEFFEEVRRH